MKFNTSNTDPKALEAVAVAAKAVNDFLKAHPKKLTPDEHGILRTLLSNRASAMSKVLGKTVHTIF